MPSKTPTAANLPALSDVARWKQQDRSSALFDGDDSMFKSLLQNARIYGEYGCGASTKWVLVNVNAEVYAVDTSIRWIDAVTAGLSDEALRRAQISHIDLGELGNWGRPIGYTKRNQFINYTNRIWEGTQRPDTVLIDGRFRVCSFLTSLKYSKEGTSIIFDDYTNRPCYHIVENFVKRADVCGRQCLFVTPSDENIDYHKLDKEIDNFRHVMD